MCIGLLVAIFNFVPHYQSINPAVDFSLLDIANFDIYFFTPDAFYNLKASVTNDKLILQ